MSIGHDCEPSERWKATLYCWGCNHASPADGDWAREPRGKTVALVCPDCGTVLDERPRENDGPSPLEAWGRVVRTSVSVWQASVGVGTRISAAPFDRRDER
ncbi:hypothetical protein [Natronococcus sp. A-GB7]|uniref:hypothetical protein n=1 Tax=Natronococcus sp. A-GB7 TaxID=3037649 RepID=UPI00241E3B03|nr:hypothetical protein [Natronococcus sp. A-GB7]MDG5820959.1 hypothetical protein [Natronococcus sp. A-GB7]